MRAAALALLFVTSAFTEPHANIRIEPGHAAGKTIPRTVFGTFLEPIGKSIYGGVWAELLTNGSFEDGLWSTENIARMTAEDRDLVKASSLGLPLPWKPLDPQQGNRYEPRRGDAANSSRSLEIIGVPGFDTGIFETIYLPTHRIRDYRGSIYAKHLGGPETLKLVITSNSGKHFAEAEVRAAATDWTRYEFSLSVDIGVDPLVPLHFLILVDGDERVLVDQASLMPADNEDGLDPDEIQMTRYLKTPLLRFGGNFTSGYHWRDGIGPRDKRVSTLNIAWGIPEYNTFGTDELLHFCQAVGAEPQIAVNLGSGTAQEAADWVRYVDGRWPTHGGLLWELGNELWGTWNLGYPTLAELPKRTADFSEAIRAVDPQARLIATGQDPDRFQEWNAAQLKNPPETFQLISTHFVVTTHDVVSSHSTPEGTAEAAFALPVELGRRLEAMQQQIDAARKGEATAHIAFTEWLFWSDNNRAPNFLNMGGAVTTAGFLNMLLTHAAIVPVSDMTGLMEFAGIWKKREQVYPTPSYFALQFYTTADIDHLVEVQNNVGGYRVNEGVRRLPDIDGVPFLDTVAAVNKSGKRLTIFCVNRNLKHGFTGKISLAGATARSAKAEVVEAPSIYDSNDEVTPLRIRPQERQVEGSGKDLQFTFPRASVTRIVVEL